MELVNYTPFTDHKQRRIRFLQRKPLSRSTVNYTVTIYVSHRFHLPSPHDSHFGILACLRDKMFCFDKAVNECGEIIFIQLMAV